ncbi:MAG: alpha-galactosidase, partial [Oscillibacter sp.]|nr:alpha-galactosidase [Oscillibacter sp.]
ATESQGECYGVMPVYSGSHRTDVELDQTGAVRMVAGINQDTFAWTLEPGGTFHTPEVFLSFTTQGLTALSHNFHRFLRRNLCPPRWMDIPRPVLLNNWEATYFDFNTEKLIRIAEQAGELGVDLLVLDDGWFGARNDDNRALGDWTVNEEKLPGGLDALTARMDELGLRFGLWIEPEMISEDSNLYRAHPDWALRVPGREPAMGRNQLVLDLGRREVLDWLYDTFSDLLRRHKITYIKWDMNRCLTDVYSHALPPDRQGEAGHRYVLGLYELARRLTEDFPDVLFEGCSGGGGRFDAGMLAYFPQIWCSDDTDAVERLEIQRGTSFGYPPASMGAHVSAVPNHQTGRSTPLGTRATVAMAGTFGYELDLNRLSPEERDQVRIQIARFREYDKLHRDGDYYRLSSHDRDGREAGAFGVTGRFSAWEFVSPDKSEALASLVVTHIAANPGPLHFRWKGLDPAARYRVVRREFFGNMAPAGLIYSQSRADREEVYTGAALMYGGTTLPQTFGDYPSIQIYIRKV